MRTATSYNLHVTLGIIPESSFHLCFDLNSVKHTIAVPGNLSRKFTFNAQTRKQSNHFIRIAVALYESLE